MSYEPPARGVFFMAKITKFYFVKATYLLGDDWGNEVKMSVDYQNNKFRLCGTGLKKEAAVVATNLLQRKHGVNFADKIEVY